MTAMLEHDARASERALLTADAQADATHVTHARTHADEETSSLPGSNASPAGGQDDSSPVAFEYGIEWRWRDGRTFISVVSQTHAEAIVDDHDPREYNPHPVRIVRRPVAEWLPAPTEKQAK